jgi:hypothetical protein
MGAGHGFRGFAHAAGIAGSVFLNTTCERRPSEAKKESKYSPNLDGLVV